ncbi:MAG: hypothetical protein R2839_00980 [Thermomicrobiales bacterium]
MVTQLQLERPYTASDLAEIDDESNRYKIVGGELIGLPTPSRQISVPRADSSGYSPRTSSLETGNGLRGPIRGALERA